MLSYISTWEFLRTLEKCKKHLVTHGGSLCTSLVFLKIPKCLYNSTIHLGTFFISLIYATLGSHRFSERRWLRNTMKISLFSYWTSLLCIWNSWMPGKKVIGKMIITNVIKRKFSWCNRSKLEGGGEGSERWKHVASGSPLLEDFAATVLRDTL